MGFYGHSNASLLNKMKFLEQKKKTDPKLGFLFIQLLLCMANRESHGSEQHEGEYIWNSFNLFGNHFRKLNKNLQ